MMRLFSLWLLFDMCLAGFLFFNLPSAWLHLLE